MDRVDQIAARAFLGEEFLTWLWFRSERDEGSFELDGEPLGLYLDDQLALVSDQALSHQDTFKGGAPAASPEAHMAARLGKKVASARMLLKRDVREWSFTLKGRGLDLSSVKLPAILRPEEDARFTDRLVALDQLDETLTGLYSQFLGLRLGEAWQGELQEMRRWVARPILDQV